MDNRQQQSSDFSTGSMDTASKRLYFCILFVGLHSLALGIFIFFFTSEFYTLFFGVNVENFFFVKQAGLFLFCLGLFYLVPLVDLRKNHYQVDVIILTKLFAVAFLLNNMGRVPRPSSIILAAICDAVMGSMLIFLSRKAGLLLKTNGRKILP